MNDPGPVVQAGDQMPSLDKFFVVYGPLGVLCLLCIYVIVRQYRDGRADRVAHQEQLKKEREQCEAERKQWVEDYRTLEERYIAKVEAQLEKFNDLARGLKEVVGSAVKSYRRGGGRDGSDD